MRHKLTDELRTRRYIRLRSRFFAVIFLFMVTFMLFTASAVMLLQRWGMFHYLMRSPLLLLLSIYVLSLLIASALAVYVSKNILKPMEQLGNASQRVAAGNFQTRIASDSDTEELNVTFSNFNAMVQELGSIETLRNDFIANVSHEFKTPLAAIEGYTMLLQDASQSAEEREECVKKILLNTARLSDLTGNILLLSKLENQSVTGENIVYRLDEQIREAILLQEPKWSAKEIEWDLDLPDTKYFGAMALLEQVWSNLVSNAVKFVPDKGGKIAIRLQSVTNGITVTVSDNGVGMSENTMKHIFEKFYQGDTSHKAQGNGLGLALCREILNKCNGSIAVRSTEGVGSIFTIHLHISAEAYKAYEPDKGRQNQ